VTTEIVVVLLGLAFLGKFVRLVLFTPVEEERPASYRSALHETPLPERYRFRGLRLLRQPRHC
jgi:hypothetical protein